MSPSPNEITVLLADDHPIVNFGLHQLLDLTIGFCVVAEAHDGEEALTQIRQHQPQLALLDIDMPRLDGFRVAAAARAEKLPSKIVFLSIHNEFSFVKKALRLGACGYILKETSPAEIVQGLRKVQQGEVYLSPALTTQLVEDRISASQVMAPLTKAPVDFSRLTPTEYSVLRLIAECRTTREIASQLFTSPRTVETHRTNICHKLGLRGNHALIKFALAHQDQL